MSRSPSLAPRTGQMLDDLRRLVEVESPSGDRPGLAASASVLSEILTHRLGGEVVLIDSEAGPHVHWRGGRSPQVLILGHHDTVFPRGTLERRPFSVVGGRATGPGVFDMLGGLVQAIHGLAMLADRTGVEMLITADEEVGSHTSRGLIEQRARACGAVLVVEGAAEGGALKTGRKGCGTFRIEVSGRAAHAGLEPEAGVNAVIEAANQVLVLAAANAPEVGTTVTPTVISGGTTDNVVPATSTILVDVRVATEAERERVEHLFATLTPQLHGAGLTVHGSIARPPMPEENAAPLFAIATQLLPGIQSRAVGGGSDGNFTAALGIPTLDGLGAVGGGAHADHEYISVSHMSERAELLAGLVDAIRQRHIDPTSEAASPY